MPPGNPQSGNVIFFILLAILLIGLVTAALRSGGMDGASIDKEQLLVRASEVKQYATELERAAVFILTAGSSELDIRFAHPDAPSDYGNDYNVTPGQQVFSPEGGGAAYRLPPQDILVDPNGNPSTPPDIADIRWEFYGRSALPGVGSDEPDLIAVLPFVSANFCAKINEMNELTGQPADTGGALADCLDSGATGRFSNADGTSGTSDDYDSAPNSTNAASFSAAPAMEGCVLCDTGGYHFYHVLHAR